MPLPRDNMFYGFVPYLEHFRDKPYAKVVDLTINFRGQLAQDADALNW